MSERVVTEAIDIELGGRRFRLSLSRASPTGWLEGAPPRLRVHPLLAAAQRGQRTEELYLALGAPIFLGEPEEEVAPVEAWFVSESRAGGEVGEAEVPPPPAEPPLRTAAAEAAEGLTRAERTAIAVDTGRWAGALASGGFREADRRGLTSRRREVTLAPRVWVALVGFDGTRYEPALVARAWRDIAGYVKVGGDLGRSVQVSWPSLYEARAFVAAAGAVWPPLHP